MCAYQRVSMHALAMNKYKGICNHKDTDGFLGEEYKKSIIRLTIYSPILYTIFVIEHPIHPEF